MCRFNPNRVDPTLTGTLTGGLHMNGQASDLSLLPVRDAGHQEDEEDQVAPRPQSV